MNAILGSGAMVLASGSVLSDVSPLIFLLLGALVFLGMAVAVLLVLREVACWYWKINARMAILEEMRDALRALKPATAAAPDGRAQHAKAATPPAAPLTSHAHDMSMQEA